MDARVAAVSLCSVAACLRASSAPLLALMASIACAVTPLHDLKCLRSMLLQHACDFESQEAQCRTCNGAKGSRLEGAQHSLHAVALGEVSQRTGAHSMEAIKELFFLLVIQCVCVADIGQRLLCFQRWKDDFILSLHKEASGSSLPEQLQELMLPAVHMTIQTSPSREYHCTGVLVSSRVPSHPRFSTDQRQ